MRKNIRFTLKACPAVALVTLVLCSLTQYVAKLFGIELPAQANIEMVSRMAGFNLNFAFLVAQIVLILPAVEEIVFRLPLLATKKKHPSATKAIAVALSILFSAAHYISQPFPDTAFVALFFFGIAQSYIYVKTGSILCAMINHALFNLANIIILLAVASYK